MAKYNRAVSFQTVEIPTKNITRHQPNLNKGSSVIYINYRYDSKYKPELKRSVPLRANIGKLTTDGTRLIPNDNYYKYFKDTSVIIKRDNNHFVKSYGNYYIINKVAKTLNLYNHLSEVFDDEMRDILLDLAHYMIFKGNALMKHIDLFGEQNIMHSKRVLSDSLISSFFATITESDITSFFRLLAKDMKKNEMVAIDVTSISSYSTKCDFSYGYNRDDDNLPQTNVIFMYGVESKMPYYYEEYDGSINDKTGLFKILDHISNLGYKLKETVFLMDSVFPTVKNLNEMDRLGISYISCIEPNNVNIKNAIIKLGNISKNINTFIKDKKGNMLYAIKEAVNGYSNRTCIYYYSSKRRDNDVAKFLNQLNLIDEKIEQIEELNRDELKLVNDLYDCESDKNNNIIKANRNQNKIDQYAERFGYFTFITNIKDITPVEVINKYGLRFEVEISIDEIKNDIHSRRKKTHNSATNRGKMFSQFISLMIRSHMRNAISIYNDKYKTESSQYKNKYSNLEHITPKDILNENALIQATNIYGDTSIFKPISKKLRSELEVFEISENDIQSSVVDIKN